MKVRAFKKKDIETYKKWYGTLLNEPFDESLLPETGFAVCTDEFGEHPVAFAFLILTNSPVCFIDYVLRHPGVGKSVVFDAYKALYPIMEKTAAGLGCKRLYAFTQVDTIEKYALDCGFVKNDLKFTGMKKEL